MKIWKKIVNDRKLKFKCNKTTKMIMFCKVHKFIKLT